ncbi:MAG: hypothetical protein ABEJ31_07995 [Haloarculaceae archaeon]
MVPLVALFAGVPGGPELLVLLIVMVLVFGVPFVLVSLGGFAYLRRDEHVDALAERIADLDEESATEDA